MTDVNPLGSDVDLLTEGDAQAREPISITESIGLALARVPADALRRPAVEAIARAHARNQRRRAAILKYADLRKRLQSAPLDYPDATQWNGYIPPATINPGESELARSPKGRLSQRGKYTIGEQANDDPRRAALLEISRIAWDREQAAKNLT